MARGKTFKFGKTLINVSSRGIATKDTATGEIKRHAFPWTDAPRPNKPDVQEPESDEEEAQQDYEDEEAGEGYYAGGYDEEDYEREYDEDADDEEYDDEAYDEEAEEEDESARPAGLLGSTWFMWLMLIVLPPLGIWLLWRNNRYEITPRSAISAAAVVWFIVLLIWLFSHIGGRDNTVVNVPTPSPSPSPTVEAQLATASPTPNVNATDAVANADPAATDAAANPAATGEASTNPTPNTAGTAIVATATPDPSATGSPSTGANPALATFVYSTSTGKYYHSYSTCSNMVNPDRVTLSVALSRRQTACPDCWVSPSASAGPTNTPLPAGMYYYRPDGTYYHLDPNCQGMRNAQLVSEADAIAAGKTSCPTCIGSVYMTSGGTYYHAISTCTGMKNAKKVTITEAKNAGKTACPTCLGGTPTDGTTTVTGNEVYYATTNGTWYHADATCQGMTNAYRTSAAAAEQAGKTPCPKCLNGNSGAANYYATSTGQWYHTNRNCQGMANASRVSLATAIARGQTACPVCAGGSYDTANKGGQVTVNTENAVANTNTKTSDSTYFSTIDGTYFHKNPSCSGMKGADVVSAKDIAARGQTPCPRCIGTSGIYYSTPTGSYFHANPTCSGMTGANIVTLAMIRSRGQTPCPKCIGGEGATSTSTGGEANGNYWATATGEYYHLNSTCRGMKNAVRVTQATAEARGQTPCPTCIGSVYTAGGRWYHKDPTCQGMTGAKLITIQAAEQAGQTACPVCIGGAAPAAPTATPKPTAAPNDDNTLYYYATASGQYYHRTATCTGMTGASRVSEATALARGQTACPKCIGSVYATDNGDYYHSNPNCSGMKGAHLMTVDQAELSGKSPCPTCMGGTSIPSPADTSTGTTDTGTTTAASNGDIEVWVGTDSKRYHIDATCAGLENPASTTLAQAVSDGYERCGACNAPALTN